MTSIEAARAFMAALQDRDAERAASVCSEGVVIELPGGNAELRGRDGARQLMRMAPPFVRTIRDERVVGDTVVLRGLTRAPGQFANYTTWTFETADGLITHVTFRWRPAN